MPKSLWAIFLVMSLFTKKRFLSCLWESGFCNLRNNELYLVLGKIAPVLLGKIGSYFILGKVAPVFSQESGSCLVLGKVVLVLSGWKWLPSCRNSSSQILSLGSGVCLVLYCFGESCCCLVSHLWECKCSLVLGKVVTFLSWRKWFLEKVFLVRG